MLAFYEHCTSHELQKLLPAQGFFGFNVNKNLKNPNALNRQPDTGRKLVPRTTNSRIFALKFTPSLLISTATSRRTYFKICVALKEILLTSSS